MIIYYSGSGFVKDKTEAEDLMVVSIMLSAWEILTEAKSQRERVRFIMNRRLERVKETIGEDE